VPASVKAALTIGASTQPPRAMDLATLLMRLPGSLQNPCGLEIDGTGSAIGGAGHLLGQRSMCPRLPENDRLGDTLDRDR